MRLGERTEDDGSEGKHQAEGGDAGSLPSSTQLTQDAELLEARVGAAGAQAVADEELRTLSPMCRLK